MGGRKGRVGIRKGRVGGRKGRVGVRQILKCLPPSSVVQSLKVTKHPFSL